MSKTLVECIANYSEARRPEVVEAISQAITSVEGVYLLDRHSDLDHNRTVLTFVGPLEQVEEAAFRSIAKAGELISLDEHTGEHPRIGATDVVPFVPISGVTMADCVELARRVGQRVGQELSIPVYLYEEAATRPERKNLENIRRGQYEALKVEIDRVPDREPDYGPLQVGPAGATVIGARQPLIAFNVYLTTDDVAVAKKIAKAVRHSSGGLRYVKGLGLLVEGRAQVSMNLTNYRETPIGRVVEMIRREAERYGVGVHHSELVGLIPQEALADAAQWYLQLDQFEPEQVLERRLQAVLQSEQEEVPTAETAGPVQTWGSDAGGQSFLDALASGSATPGGGSAAAFAGASAAALVAMVARLTSGKKKYAEVEETMQEMLEQAEHLRAELTKAVERDSQAFEAVMGAYRLPKETPADERYRADAIERATLGATYEPLEVARRAVEVLELAVRAMQIGNVNAISDVGTGAALAQAALTGAGLNVRINAGSLRDQQTGQKLLAELRSLEERAGVLSAEARQTMAGRGGVSQP